MRNLLLTVVGACLAMLATSGVVALATAKPATAMAASLPKLADAELEAEIGGLIDAQYQRLVTARTDGL